MREGSWWARAPRMANGCAYDGVRGSVHWHDAMGLARFDDCRHHPALRQPIRACGRGPNSDREEGIRLSSAAASMPRKPTLKLVMCDQFGGPSIGKADD